MRCAHAQAPAWQTAVALNGAASTVKATTTDANGDVYVAGPFTGTVGFGTASLTSAGGVDVFVAKWSRASASFVWAQRAGGTGDESATAVAVSSAGVYVAGDFAGTMTFGGHSISSSGLSDGFVAKLTDGGNGAGWEWAVPLGGADSDQAYALAVSDASVYVAGVFNSATLQLGAFALANRSTNGATADGFVAKLTDGGLAGTVAWVQQVGGSGSDFVTALAATGSTVYLTGQFSNAVAFGNTTLQGISAGAFVAKLADAGPSSQFAWAIQPSGLVIANAVAVAGSNVYVAGRFVFRVAFGSASFTSTGNLNGYDAFVTKITDVGGTGSFAWTAVAGGPFSDYAAGVATSGANVYVTGGFSNTCAFGNTSLTNVGNNDNIFVTKLTDAGSTGSFAWAMPVGGAGPQLATSVAVDAGRRVYVGGDATLPVAFGSILLPATAGARVGFLASFADATTTGTGPGLAAARLAVYPNPAHGRASVQLPPGAGPATLTVLDALGRPVRTQTTTNPSADLDLTGLAPGLYAVRVAAGGSSAIQRLVVE
ncbi:T9SS type A sorting domain-containing protein [Hymenobacter convexus]|uniref:T9SS type A sorting domain-containing protein n=1 Tax=Hymenobacter sp. CA1UV-4 TaxID=3063782 RepID=UPI00271448C1|nr:T9SS type A sorting domain-containing protein [Hymenobacter sp. CA1UV-4]MDO7850551.1 T9SS type A sorting domain-containing protein [Hymenobacter sp. CA1UV-4]